MVAPSQRRVLGVVQAAQHARLDLPVAPARGGAAPDPDGVRLRQPVAVARNASQDPRFRFFSELPEDRYEAFLSVPVLCRGRVVGVINLQHQLPHEYTGGEIKLISTIGFLVGAEIEMARLDSEISHLSEQLETRKLVERAKGLLQRELGLSEADAYSTLQRQSRQRRKSMKEIAEAIILADEVRRPA